MDSFDLSELLFLEKTASQDAGWSHCSLPIVLGRWESPQCPVKHPSGPGNLLLFGQKLAVVHPESRHLVHKHEAPLERIVDVLVAGVGDTAAFNLLASCLQHCQVHIHTLMNDTQFHQDKTLYQMTLLLF